MKTALVFVAYCVYHVVYHVVPRDIMFKWRNGL